MLFMLPENTNILKREQIKTILLVGEFRMSETHSKSKRTKTGAKRNQKRDKIKAELGRDSVPVTVGKDERKPMRGMGGNIKQSMRKASMVNVKNPKTDKVEKTEIKTVLENPANRHYVRRNIITKGAIVETAIGKVKVTSRPGQDGVVNGILLKD